MTKHLNLCCAGVLLAVGIILLQAHAMPFWRGLGLGVPISLEAGALWLLFQRGRTTRLLGLLAALAILSAPLWQVGQPVFAQMQAIASHTQQLNAHLHQPLSGAGCGGACTKRQSPKKAKRRGVKNVAPIRLDYAVKRHKWLSAPRLNPRRLAFR